MRVVKRSLQEKGKGATRSIKTVETDEMELRFEIGERTKKRRRWTNEMSGHGSSHFRC
jgi:hypothetical protein